MTSPIYQNPHTRKTAGVIPLDVPNLPADRDILEGLLPSPVQTIEKPAACADADEIRVRDLKYIGSYNWVESQKPTIIVPGKDVFIRRSDNLTIFTRIPS